MFQCNNESCQIYLSGAKFPNLMDCPLCKKPLAEERFEIPASEDFFIDGESHFSDRDKFNSAIEKIINTYPAVIVEKFQLAADNSRTYRDRCLDLRDVYYISTRVLGLVAVSYYLNDPSASPAKNIQQKLAQIVMPYDSTWKELLIIISSYYKESGLRFFIPGFIENVIFLSEPENGYKNAIYGGIKCPQFKKASILQAAVDLRNAIFHESIHPDEDDCKKIFNFYFDIVLTMLDKMDFLSGDRFLCVVKVDEDNFVSVHGKKEKPVIIRVADDEYKLNESAVFIYDQLESAIFPLYPFFVKFEKLWNSKKEFIFDSISNNTVMYSSRRGYKESELSGYNKIKELILGKKIELTFDINKINFPYFKEIAKQTTKETLENSYINKKYFPDCYIRREENESLISSFLASEKNALFISGGAGIGKSSFLSDIAYRCLEENFGLSIPLFLNARDAKKTNTDNKPIFNLIRENFMLSNDAGGIEYCIDRIHQMIHNDTSSVQKPQVIFLIDAVNESFSTRELLDEIDGIVCRCYDYEKKKSKYPWLKIIFSIRSTGLHSLKAFNNFDGDLFKNNDLYYKASGPVISLSSKINIKNGEDDCYAEDHGITGVNLIGREEHNDSPVIFLNEFTAYEIVQAFETYRANKTLYPLLSQVKDLPKLSGNKIKLLGNPLFLWLYLNVMEKNGGKEPEIGESADKLFGEYYVLIIKDHEVMNMLDSICHKMVMEAKAPVLKTSSISEIVYKFRRLAEERAERFYTDPLEKLISQGIIERRRKYSIGEAPEDYVSFTQQKFMEYSLFQYFIRSIGSPSKVFVESLLNSDSDFEEYNNAVVLGMKKLWNSNEFLELAKTNIEKNTDRFRRLFSDTIFDNFEAAINEDVDYEKFIAIVGDFKKRIDLLVSDSDNLRNIPCIMDIFLWEAAERFSKRKYGNFICKISYPYAFTIIKLLKLKNDYARAVCLSAMAGTAKKEDRMDEALKFHLESIDLRIAIQRDAPTNEIKEYIASMRSTGASIIFKETGDINLALKFGLAVNFSSVGNIYLGRKNLENAVEAYKSFFKTALYIIEILPLNKEIHDNINAALSDFNVVLKAGKKFKIFLLKQREKDPNFNNVIEDNDIFRAQINFAEEITKEIDKTIECYNRKINIFIEKFLNDPADIKIKMDIADLYYSIGNIYYHIDDYEKACCNFLKCSSFLSIAKDDNFSSEIENKLADSYYLIASAYYYSKNYKNALLSIQNCLNIRKASLTRDPENKIIMLNLANAYKIAGKIHFSLKKYKEEIEILQQSVALHKKLSEYGVEYLKFMNSLANIYEGIGNAFKFMKKPEEALNSYLSSIEIKEKLCLNDPENYNYQNSLGLTLFKIEKIHSMQASHKDSLEILTRALQIFERINIIKPDNINILNNLAQAYEKMGLLYETINDMDKAIIYGSSPKKLQVF